jgi:hypothetical protein
MSEDFFYRFPEHKYPVGTAFWLSADGKNAVPTTIRCL